MWCTCRRGGRGCLDVVGFLFPSLRGAGIFRCAIHVSHHRGVVWKCIENLKRGGYSGGDVANVEGAGGCAEAKGQAPESPRYINVVPTTVAERRLYSKVMITFSVWVEGMSQRVGERVGALRWF
jgi:hypothetical protein